VAAGWLCLPRLHAPWHFGVVSDGVLGRPKLLHPPRPCLAQVPFDRPMQPAGNVEAWLGEVERRMKSSVRAQVASDAAVGSGLRASTVWACFPAPHCLTAQAGRCQLLLEPPEPKPPGTPRSPQIMAAMAAYGSKPRAQWVCDWPAMVVLAATQIFWSAGVEAAVAEGAVPAFLGKCTDDLMALTDLVRGCAVFWHPVGAKLGRSHASLHSKQLFCPCFAALGANGATPRRPGAWSPDREPAPDAGRAHHHRRPRARRGGRARRIGWGGWAQACGPEVSSRRGRVAWRGVAWQCRAPHPPGACVRRLPRGARRNEGQRSQSQRCAPSHSPSQGSRTRPTLSGCRGCATTGATARWRSTWSRQAPRGA
jgi:hypothetical protein